MEDDLTGKQLTAPIWTRNFCLLALANLVLFMSIQVLLPTLPIYLLNIGGDQRDVGLVMGAFTISAMTIRPIAGWLIDRFGRKAILLLGIALMLTTSVLYHAAATVALLLLVRAIHGIAYSISTTATGTMVVDILPKSRLGEGMGYFGLTSSLSMALAPMIGLWLVDFNGYSTLFIAISTLSLLALLSSTAVKSPFKPTHNKGDLAKIDWANLFERNALPASIVMFFLATVFGAVISFIALHAAERGIANIGLFFTANALAMMISRLISGRWADKNRTSMILLIGHLAIFISMIIIVISATIKGFILAGIIYGIGFGFCIPTLQALAVRNTPPHRRGAATASFFTAFDFGIGIGTILWGFIASQAGYQLMFLTTLLPIMTAGLLYFYLKKTSYSR